MESYTDPTQTNAEQQQASVVAPSAEELHRGKATTAMVLAIVGLALLLVPGLNLAGIVLSIIGLSMAVKNRKFAEANGVKENSNNTAAFVCGLIGVIVNGLLLLFVVFVVILTLAVGVTLISAVGPAAGNAIAESAPAIQDALEGMLPAVESMITGFAGLL